MAQFSTVLSALTQGQSVRRTEWEPFVRMFVLNDQLMCQCSDMNPWLHSLTWGEVTALDWQPILAKSEGHQTSITPTRTPHAPERPLLKLSAESEPFRAVLLKWWNAD
jgi:hypothetical protein